MRIATFWSVVERTYKLLKASWCMNDRLRRVVRIDSILVGNTGVQLREELRL
jgi:hypothetical protein